MDEIKENSIEETEAESVEEPSTETAGEKKKKLNIGKALKFVLLGALAVVLCVVMRYVYIMFINPMSAFSDLPPMPVATNEPAAMIEDTPAPTDEIISGASLSPTAATTPSASTPRLQRTAKPKPTPPPTPTPVPNDTNLMKNRVNVLLLGWDQSPEREIAGSSVYRDDENNYRSDVMMLLSADFSKKTVDLISIPRDTISKIWNEKGELFSVNGNWKINAAFAKGQSAGKLGPQYAMMTVSKLLGIPIQYYAGVDMEGMKAVVDAMGGVDYDVDVRIVLNGRVLEKGYQHLNGQQALDYCRARKGISSDVGRNDRQQRLLMAIFYQLKSRDQLKNIPNIYLSVKDYVSTNLKLEQIAALATLGVQMQDKNLKRHTLKGTYVNNTTFNNASYYVLNNDELVALIEKVFGITITPNPRYDIAYVLAEKAARDARLYITSALYLIETPRISVAREYASEMVNGVFDRLNSAIYAASVAAIRPENADLDILLDVELIESTTAQLHNALLELCYMFEVTQADVQQNKLPSALYKLLPRK